MYILKIKNNFFHNHSTTKKIRKFYIDTMTVTLNPYSNVTSYSNNACYNVFFPFPDLQSNLESCIEFSLHVSLVPCGTNLWRPLSLSLSSMTLAFSKSTNQVFSRMFKNLSMSVVSSYLSHFIQIWVEWLTSNVLLFSRYLNRWYMTWLCPIAGDIVNHLLKVASGFSTVKLFSLWN